MRAVIFAFCVLIGFSGWPAMAQDDAPVAATLKDLRANPKQYDGKTVRVRGQVDNCTSLYCNLCDLQMTRASASGSCVALAFDGYPARPGSAGAAETINEVFRFALGTVIAKFDASCAPGGARTCTDSRFLLSSARVESVEGHKNALNGLISFYDYGPLSAPAVADRRAMLAELRSHGSYFEGKEVEVFRVPRSVYLPGEGLGCFCTDNSCKGKWPTRYFGGFESPANPFRCYEMEKINGVWRVLLN
jgi:hypothetical protein